MHSTCSHPRDRQRALCIYFLIFSSSYAFPFALISNAESALGQNETLVREQGPASLLRTQAGLHLAAESRMIIGLRGTVSSILGPALFIIRF
ncbi:hypothetical protein F5Y14DRAFT_400274 [Nemania sp. NC0429]|nr:hypothetical protein F5Y14DRAFT_400274 [Nemania sp. NC0429]